MSRLAFYSVAGRGPAPTRTQTDSMRGAAGPIGRRRRLDEQVVI
jgi:hypothetical protein